MTEQRTRQLMAYAVETHRLRIRKTLLAAIIPLAFMRGVVDAALESQPRWGMVSIVLPGLFWLTYAGLEHVIELPSGDTVRFAATDEAADLLAVATEGRRMIRTPQAVARTDGLIVDAGEGFE